MPHAINRALVRELGFELTARADAGESEYGAWFATSAEGAPVVLKWFPDEVVAERYAGLLPALEVLRSRGVPVPEYTLVLAVAGATISAQRVLPGRPWESVSGHGARVARPQMIDRVIECIGAAAGVATEWPGAPPLRPWGESMVRSLTVGEDGWAMHAPMRAWNRRAAELLGRIESVGGSADPSWFPTNGLVHFDLHAGNLLGDDDGSLTGIIDWEDARAGDRRFDLAAFAFDLDGAGQQIWDRVEPLIEPHLLRSYVAHLALRTTDWAIRHHPEDLPRQLDRAERVLERYDA